MKITERMLHDTVTANVPCDCCAPIAYTFLVSDGSVGVRLFVLTEDLSNVFEPFTSIPPWDGDEDDIQLRCIRCGVNWSTFSSLFF